LLLCIIILLNPLIIHTCSGFKLFSVYVHCLGTVNNFYTVLYKNKGTNKAEDNFLLFVPHIKHETWEEKKDGIYLVFYHNHPIQKLANWLVKKPNKSDIKLDKLGSTVWKLIDGSRNILEIGELVKNEFGDSCEPLYDRLIMFLRYLNRRGWIYFENVEAKKK
jgi:hypothetical protein